MTVELKQAPEISVAPKKEGRNMGVELFRVFAMLMVVYLHMTGYGGVLAASEPLSANYKITLFLQVLTYCAVNCYALISGFANVKTEFKFRRIVYLWVETVFLITALNAVMHFFVPDVTVPRAWWISGLFPLTKRELWYLCAYFFMFPLIPVLNKGLLSLKRWQHIAVIVMLQVPTVLQLIAKEDNYKLSNGYSAIWLICLYVIGAYFRIYGAPRWAKPFVTLPAFFLAAGVAYGYRIIPEMRVAEGTMEATSEWYVNRSMLVSYVSPCMVIMSVMLLLFFMQIRISDRVIKKAVAILAKATWGVFALHVSSPFWYYPKFWAHFPTVATYTPVKMLLTFLAMGLVMYLALSAVSIGQSYLFKLLRVNRGIDFLADLPAKWQKRKESSSEPSSEA